MQSCECCKFLFYTADLLLSENLLSPDINVCPDCQVDEEHKDDIWKEIPDFSGYYISLLGKVKGIRCETVSTDIRDGYQVVSLFKNSSSLRQFTHRLLLLTYRPNPEDKSQVDHIDQNSQNNLLSNLRWATHAENSQNRSNKGFVSVLQCNDAGNVIARFPSLKEAAASVGTAGVSQALRKGCKSGGYYWKYENEDHAVARSSKPQEMKPVEHRPVQNLDRIFKNYLITASGDVYSTCSKKYISRKYVNDYPSVSLWENNRQNNLLVHRLVAFTYLEPAKNPKQIYVNHKNGIRTDCGVENLEWCTHSENMQQARAISVCKFSLDKEFLECFPSIFEASKSLDKNGHYGISKSCKGIRKSSYGYIWAYTSDCKWNDDLKRYEMKE